MAETKISSKFVKARKAFGVIFIVSASLTVILFIISGSLMSSPPTLSNSSAPPPPPQNTSFDSDVPPPSQQPIIASNTSQPNYNASPQTPPPLGVTNSGKSTGNSSTAGNYNSNNTIARQSTPRIYPATPNYGIQPGTSPRLFSSNYTFLAVGAFSLIFVASVSLLGFFTMAILAWRREKQEKERLNLENRRKAQEVERLKFELERSRQASNSGEVKQCPVCKKMYADSSLRFCIDDGATLSFSFNPAKTASNSSDKTLNLDDETPTRLREPR